MCFSAILEDWKYSWLLLILKILRTVVMQVVLINECKSCAISNQCTVFIFKNKSQTGYDKNIAK